MSKIIKNSYIIYYLAEAFPIKQGFATLMESDPYRIDFSIMNDFALS